MAKHFKETSASVETVAERPHKGKEFEPVPDKKPKRKHDVLSTILILAGIVLLAAAAVMFLNNKRNYDNIDEINDEVAEYAKLTDDAETPPAVDWAGLREMNPDIVGWLQIPNTVVNYPVYQSGDNDFYLHHAPDRSYSIGGAVFLDAECTKPGMEDPQTIVYGHHMRNGSQFKQVADMDKQEMFDGVNLVWYCVEKDGQQVNYDLAPVFLYYTNEGDTDVRQFTFENDAKYREYIKMYFDKAVTKRPDAEEILKQVEHIFTLSTCNYIDGQGRTLLVCVPRAEIPGTPQYDAAAPIREQKRREAEEAARKAAEEEKKRAEEEKKRAEEEAAQPQEEVVIEEEVIEE